MTRLFGCICNQPQRFAEALSPVKDALVAAAPVPRWGLAYVQAGEVLLSRNPRPTDESVDLFAAAERLQSDYVIGHAAEEDGLSGNANTQPLRFRRWMFAQEGNVAGPGAADEVCPRLLEHIPDFLRRNIKGKSAGEHVFHVFLAMLHDTGSLDDPNLPLATTRRALRATVALVADAVTRAGGGVPPGNIVVSNSRSMLAARLDLPLYFRRLSVAGPKKGRDETFRGVLALSASAHPGEGFEEIPERSVLGISRDIVTDIAELDG